MLVKTSYVCSLCGAEYATSEEAICCEGMHQGFIPERITKAEFSPSPELRPYPWHVHVQMPDGRVLRYTRDDS